MRDLSVHIQKSSSLIVLKQQGGEDAALLKACAILPLTGLKYASRPCEEAQEVGKAVVVVRTRRRFGQRCIKHLVQKLARLTKRTNALLKPSYKSRSGFAAVQA